MLRQTFFFLHKSATHNWWIEASGKRTSKFLLRKSLTLYLNVKRIATVEWCLFQCTGCEIGVTHPAFEFLLEQVKWKNAIWVFQQLIILERALFYLQLNAIPSWHCKCIILILQMWKQRLRQLSHLPMWYGRMGCSFFWYQTAWVQILGLVYMTLVNLISLSRSSPICKTEITKH